MSESIELSRSGMWAMAHPLRFRIWELLREGPSTASQVARRLGESRGSASYHLRILARAGLITEDESLGQRMLAVFFARDEEVRSRFLLGRASDEWQEASLVVNWFVPLTPAEADELGLKLFALVDELRHRTPPPEAEQTLISLSVLPVLGDDPSTLPDEPP